MDKLLEQLKQARLKTEDAARYVEDCEHDMKQTIEYNAWQNAKLFFREEQAKIEEIDALIRQTALSIYEMSQNKHPHDKVSIAVNLEVLYEEEAAKAWCINNALGMLKVDSKQFEKHAKAVLKTVPLPFVKVEEKPSVRIAREL